MSARVLFNITHGFQARMLLRTRIAGALRDAGCDVIVVSPNADEAYFRAEFDQPGFRLEVMPRRYRKPEKLVVSTRAYFLMNPSLGATLNFKRERYKKNYPWRHRMTRAGNLLLGNVPALRRAYLAAERALFDGSEFDDLFARHRPDLVVAGTPGFNVNDAHLLRAARRNRIPSATVMLSWDNLTSKGYMGAQPDYLLVWSDLMRREAVRYHDFRGPIIEVGAAQFDIYRAVAREVDCARFRRANGVPEGAELVVWGTINNQIYPDQLALLERFVAHLEAGPRSRFLWIRIHPQTLFGPFKHLLPAYRALASERVKVELPRVASETLRWDLPGDDMRHLASLMKAARVVITPRSTLTIDAACVDTPVINLAIDPEFARGFGYTHYRNIVKHDGVVIARSFAELCAAVDRYLADPSLHRAGRRAIVAEQQGRFFGHASERTAAVLVALARGEPAPGAGDRDREEPRPGAAGPTT